MKFRILALDLEGTLISNAFSQFPRPGLYHFLDFCYRSFDRVVFFTCVPEKQTQQIIHALVAEGLAPAEALYKFEYVKWKGLTKDLRFVSETEPSEVLLVDDQSCFVRSDQLDNWIPIKEYSSPYLDSDRELEHTLKQIQSRIFRSCRDRN